MLHHTSESSVFFDYTIFMNSNQNSPPLQSNSHSAGQEVPSLLRELRFHYQGHKITPLVPILIQTISVPITPPYSRSILILHSTYA